MKKTIILLWILCAVSMGHAAVTGTVLFSDSFDRTDNTDIDADSNGMGGSLAPMIYQEVFEGSGAASSIQVLSNELNIAVGAGMSSFYLDHNFIDADILSADGFSISMDVVSITNADDTANRFGGFGVGNTRDEANAAMDSFDSDGPLRPNTARANQDIGVSDLYVDLALDQNLRIWSNGNVLNTINVGAASGTIKADFFVTDFNAGSEVTVVVSFNGVYQDTQTFTWDNTDNNYIGISGRTAGAGVFMDNLSIASFYEDRANTPSPADGESMVNASGLALSWNKGKDSAGNPNALIDEHYLYITDIVTDGEPNFVGVSAIVVPDTVDPVSDSSYTFASDTMYYWRVDEGFADVNDLTGYVWSFDTFTFPAIDQEPAGQAVEVDGTAEFECYFSSMTTPTVTWYKEAGEVDDPVDADDPDITIGVPENLGDDAFRATLTIVNIEVGDEGEYYCIIENSSGPDNAVPSALAGLGVKRKVAHWTLDKSSLVDGVYQDVTGNHPAEPNIVPGDGSFTTGPDNVAKSALNLTVESLAAADSGEWIPALYTGEVTISAWLNWAGSNDKWQGVVSNRTLVDGAPRIDNFYIEIRQDNGNLQIGGIPGLGDLQIDPLPEGKWVHLAITAKAGEVVMYIDGISMNSSDAAEAVPQNSIPVYIGSLNRSLTTGELVSLFNGSMDDVRLYNYALTNKAVADLYYEVKQIPVCLNLDGVDLQFDVAGGGTNGDEPDCRIDMADFAVFAQTWLNDGLYSPQQ